MPSWFFLWSLAPSGSSVVTVKDSHSSWQHSVPWAYGSLCHLSIYVLAALDYPRLCGPVSYSLHFLSLSWRWVLVRPFSLGYPSTENWLAREPLQPAFLSMSSPLRPIGDPSVLWLASCGWLHPWHKSWRHSWPLLSSHFRSSITSLAVTWCTPSFSRYRALQYR